MNKKIPKIDFVEKSGEVSLVLLSEDLNLEEKSAYACQCGKSSCEYWLWGKDLAILDAKGKYWSLSCALRDNLTTVSEARLAFDLILEKKRLSEPDSNIVNLISCPQEEKSPERKLSIKTALIGSLSPFEEARKQHEEEEKVRLALF